MYKNIVFDIGNVLLRFNPIEYMKSKIKEENIEKLFKEIFQSEEWIMLDSGTIEEKIAIENIIKRNQDYKGDIKLLFKEWYDILTPINGSIEILRELKNKGYSIYFLSNFHDLAFKNVVKKNDFFNLFDGGVASYKEKIIKPNKEIYDLLLKRYKLNAEETIFIDDTKINVEAANNMGIKGILFESPEKLSEELQEIL